MTIEIQVAVAVAIEAPPEIEVQARRAGMQTEVMKGTRGGPTAQARRAGSE